jgi:hypothetical protein
MIPITLAAVASTPKPAAAKQPSPAPPSPATTNRPAPGGFLSLVPWGKIADVAATPFAE